MWPLLLLTLLAVVPPCLSTSSFYTATSRHRTGRLQTTAVLQELFHVSRLQCLASCAATTGCTSFNFNAQLQPVCQLLGTSLCESGLMLLQDRPSSRYYDLYSNQYGAQTEADLTMSLGSCTLDGYCAVPTCVKPLGGFCSSSAQCSTPGVCSEGVCSCSTGQVQVNGMCFNNRQLTQSCLYTQQCQASTSNTLCSAGACTCASGYWSNSTTDCQPEKPLGSACADSVECAGVGECTGGSCACPTGQLLVQGTCYHYKLLTQPCHFTAQCQATTSNSICSSSVCVCGSGYINSANIQCLSLQPLGGACVSVLECDDSVNWVCTGGVCSCPVDEVLAAGGCYPISHLTESCQHTVQCQAATANTVCSVSNCVCSAGYWSNDGQCRPGVGLGGSCSYLQDCTTANSRYLCTNGVCSERICGAISVGTHEYRLVGGLNCNEGRVELRPSGGTWGVVCDDGWDINDANVFCKSLGFIGSSAAACCSSYGSGSTHIYLDDLTCSGSEAHLALCGSRGWGSHNCGSSESAAATCY